MPKKFQDFDVVKYDGKTGFVTKNGAKTGGKYAVTVPTLKRTVIVSGDSLSPAKATKGVADIISQLKGTKRASKKGSKRASKSRARKASRKGSKKASKKASKKGSKKGSKKASRKASKKGSKKASRKASRKASKKGSKQARRKASTRASKGRARKASKKTSKAKCPKGQAYCVQCKKCCKVENVKYVKTKNNRHMLQGECPDGHKINKFVSADEYANRLKLVKVRRGRPGAPSKPLPKPPVPPREKKPSLPK